MSNEYHVNFFNKQQGIRFLTLTSNTMLLARHARFLNTRFIRTRRNILHFLTNTRRFISLRVRGIIITILNILSRRSRRRHSSHNQNISSRLPHIIMVGRQPNTHPSSSRRSNRGRNFQATNPVKWELTRFYGDRGNRVLGGIDRKPRRVLRVLFCVLGIQQGII